MTRLPLLSPGWSHAVCTTIAVILALYIAYFLQLESPYSAATTVLVVASPVHGMVLAKSVYRFLGTVIGAAASVALMACFAQTPELFLLGTAIWVGIFTAMSSLLRRFRAYGAVLAGYTITLVAFGAVDNPLQIFDLAMARIAVVSIGIVCSALVTIMLAPNTASRDLPTKLTSALQGLGNLVRLALSPATDREVAASRAATARQLQALDTALYAAAAESAETAFRSGYMRRAVAAAFGVVSGISSLRQSCNTLQRLELWHLSEAAASLLDRLVQEGATPMLSADIQALRHQAGAVLAEFESNPDHPVMIAFNRLDDLLDHLAALVENLRSFADKSAKRADIRLPHYRDVPAALINGFRGMIAVGALSVFWIYTAWPNGAQLFGAMVPICALLGASDRQQADSVDFFIGVSLAAMGGLICGYGLMTQISGFPLLALAIAPFVLVAAYYSTKPKMASIATGFLIYFLTFISPRNPMQFDLAAYLNTAFANMVGIACLLPIFRLVYPQNHLRTARQLARQLVRSLGQLAAHPQPDRLLQWEHRAHDRLASIGGRLPLDDRDRKALLDGGFAAIRIGRDLVRIKSHLAHVALDHRTREMVDRAIDSIQQVTRQPGQVAERFLDAAERLDIAATGLLDDEKRIARRSVAALSECATLLVEHAAYFTGKPIKKPVNRALVMKEAVSC